MFVVSFVQENRHVVLRRGKLSETPRQTQFHFGAAQASSTFLNEEIPKRMFLALVSVSFDTKFLFLLSERTYQLRREAGDLPGTARMSKPLYI